MSVILLRNILMMIVSRGVNIIALLIRKLKNVAQGPQGDLRKSSIEDITDDKAKKTTKKIIT